MNEMLTKVLAAAEILKSLGKTPTIALGCALTEDEVEQLAAQLGTTVSRHCAVYEWGSVLIFAFHTSLLDGAVQLTGQGSRKATEEDVRHYETHRCRGFPALPLNEALALVKAA